MLPDATPPRMTLTVSETARLCRISRGAAYEAVRTGEIPSIRIGRRILVPTALLMRLLGAETEGGPVTAGPPSSPSSRPQTKGGTT